MTFNTNNVVEYMSCRSKRWLGILIVIVSIVVVGVVYTLSTSKLIVPINTPNRNIVEQYIRFAYNPFNKSSSLVPAIVNSIVWDFRGLDTLFETIVFYTAIIASIAIYHEYLTETYLDTVELSKIPKTVAILVIGASIAIGLAVAFKGHLTPGGGFQGGAVIAATLFILAATWSTYYISKLGISVKHLIVLRSLGLLGIILLSFYPLVYCLLNSCSAFIFQNQWKDNSGYLGYRYYMGDDPVSLTIIFYNVFESIAIANGFIILLYILVVSGYREKFEEESS